MIALNGPYPNSCHTGLPAAHGLSPVAFSAISTDEQALFPQFAMLTASAGFIVPPAGTRRGPSGDPSVNEDRTMPLAAASQSSETSSSRAMSAIASAA